MVTDIPLERGILSGAASEIIGASYENAAVSVPATLDHCKLPNAALFECPVLVGAEQ
jgi:hypothetical protein